MTEPTQPDASSSGDTAEEVQPIEVIIKNKDKKEEEFPTEEFSTPEYITEEEIKEFEKEYA